MWRDEKYLSLGADDHDPLCSLLLLQSLFTFTSLITKNKGCRSLVFILQPPPWSFSDIKMNQYSDPTLIRQVEMAQSKSTQVPGHVRT